MCECTMMVPLNNSSDTYTMPPGVGREQTAGDWSVPGHDSEINLSVNSVQDDKTNAEIYTDEWPVKFNKRKSQPVEEMTETGDICDLFFHQPAKKLSLLFNTKFYYKEERKRILKLSIAKLRQVDDPEVFLRRSVLINNTVRRLHRELREEKLNRSSRFSNAHSDDAKMTDHSAVLARCRSKSEKKLTLMCRSCLGVNVLNDANRSSTPGPHKSPSKRTLDVPSEQDTTNSKQSRFEATSDDDEMQSAPTEQVQSRFEATSLLAQPKDRYDNSAHRGAMISEIEKQYSQYSCGQSSIFGELQSVVFHSLIASLES